MSEITKQERLGLEELFTAIEKHRYHSKWKVFTPFIKGTHTTKRRFIMRSFKNFKK